MYFIKGSWGIECDDKGEGLHGESRWGGGYREEMSMIWGRIYFGKTTEGDCFLMWCETIELVGLYSSFGLRGSRTQYLELGSWQDFPGWQGGGLVWVVEFSFGSLQVARTNISILFYNYNEKLIVEYVASFFIPALYC